jgi:hypothetical protein
MLAILRVAGLAVGGDGPPALDALAIIARGIVIGAYQGAVAGITYSIVRDPLRKLGLLGDYLTGILCVWAYLLATVLPFQLLPERPEFAQPDQAPALALGGALVGVIIGHLWFRRRRSRHGA